MNWTKEQRSDKYKNKNVCLVAAAGSGKTAVLAERIRKLVCEEKCSREQSSCRYFYKVCCSRNEGKIRKSLGQELKTLQEEQRGLSKVAKAHPADEARERLTYQGPAIDLQATSALPCFCPHEAANPRKRTKTRCA